MNTVLNKENDKEGMFLSLKHSKKEEEINSDPLLVNEHLTSNGVSQSFYQSAY